MDGRTFGDYDRPEDLFHYFDCAQFYCWIAGKNEEASKTLGNRNCSSNCIETIIKEEVEVVKEKVEIMSNTDNSSDGFGVMSDSVLR